MSDAMTMREARAAYYQRNGFDDDGGDSRAWVEFKVGPLPMPVPNTDSRRKAVKYHDLHHVLTGYPTNYRGEFQISAWELGAGCRDYVAAWVLNLLGVFSGTILWPRAIFSAFVRGRRSQTLYGRELDGLLSMSVRDARAQLQLPGDDVSASMADVMLFMLTWLASLALVVVMTVLTANPIALVAFFIARASFRRRAALAQP